MLIKYYVMISEIIQCFVLHFKAEIGILKTAWWRWEVQFEWLWV